MRVADVTAELPERLGGGLSRDTGVMRVPEESHVRMTGALDDFEEQWRSREFAMRFDDDRHLATLCVIAEFAKPRDDPVNRRLALFAFDQLVREDADVRRVKLMRQFDEALRLVHLLRTLRGVRLVHVRRSAKVGNLQSERFQIFQAFFQLRAYELR